MERWEYLTRFIYADTENPEGREYVTNNEIYPGRPPRYAPETMEPTLNALGADGWELVHMAPVPKVGNNRDVGFPKGGDGGFQWSNAYFAVFKRRIGVNE